MRDNPKFIKCEPDDPQRCTSSGQGGSGQCNYLSLQGMIERGLYENVKNWDVEKLTCCPRCNSTQLKTVKRQAMHDYRLGKWQGRVSEFGESERVKTLRGEIGVLRMVMEETLQKCETHDDLMIWSNKIIMLASKIESLVFTCAKLEDRLGLVMDKNEILSFANKVVDVVTKQLNIHFPEHDEKRDMVIESVGHSLVDELK